MGDFAEHEGFLSPGWFDIYKRYAIIVRSMIEMKVNRHIITVSTLHDNSDDEYWQSRTPIERLVALQINRQAAYGESNASAGLQRVFEVVERS